MRTNILAMPGLSRKKNMKKNEANEPPWVLDLAL
jgi:hypothetical protein